MFLKSLHNNKREKKNYLNCRLNPEHDLPSFRKKRQKKNHFASYSLNPTMNCTWISKWIILVHKKLSLMVWMISIFTFFLHHHSAQLKRLATHIHIQSRFTIKSLKSSRIRFGAHHSEVVLFPHNVLFVVNPFNLNVKLCNGEHIHTQNGFYCHGFGLFNFIS